MTRRVVVLGALDTKGAEFAYLRARLVRAGVEPFVVDFGVMGEPAFAPDVNPAEVAAAGGADLAALRAANDRGAAMAAMGRGAAALLRQRYDAGQLDGVIGMGGGGGSSVIATAMRALP
ncbi:MAG TPA: Tm-1-like ATP-binding domain-containing protein, partial [Roseiflexaceae bacterium]